MDKKDLRKILNEDYRPYREAPLSIVGKLRNEKRYLIWKYIKCLRYEEYFYQSNHLLGKILFILISRVKNGLGFKLGFEIPKNCLGSGVTIWHGNIVINSKARVGKNCIFHGHNCIGNNGKSKGCPKIGDNVDIGFGAVIIGDITLASNITVAANAVITKSVYEENVILAGVPARII